MSGPLTLTALISMVLSSCKEGVKMFVATSSECTFGRRIPGVFCGRDSDSADYAKLCWNQEDSGCFGRYTRVSVAASTIFKYPNKIREFVAI